MRVNRREEGRDLLEHRVGPELVEHGGIRHPEKPVDYVNNSIGGGDVGGDDGGVHTAALHGDGLISGGSLHHVEVELLPVGGGRHLQEFERSLFVRECSWQEDGNRGGGRGA